MIKQLNNNNNNMFTRVVFCLQPESRLSELKK